MKIGVIGAGTMGAGIARALAVNGDHRILLCDLTPELAEAGLNRLRLKSERLVDQGRLDRAEAEEALGRIQVGSIGDCGDRDLVVEAVIEDLKIKGDLLAELDRLCPPLALLTTNTSSLPLAELGRGLNRPLTGFHFFNPAETMKLVEIVVPLTTPPEIAAKLKDVALGIDKTPVVVKDSPGFLVNRLLVPMINEAAGLLAEGAAEAEDIDAAMRLGANHPLGPLALGDLIGLDVCLAVMETLHRELGEDKYRPHPLLRKMVRHNFLGRKTGRGFFQY